MLELACYALTELAYRHDLPIEDRLAGDPDPSAQFHAPAAVLPNRAFTELDWRKRLIDLDGVKNAWIETVDDVRLYADLRRRELRRAPPEHPDFSVVPLGGLYRVRIEFMDAVGTQAERNAVLRSVRNTARSHAQSVRGLHRGACGARRVLRAVRRDRPGQPGRRDRVRRPAADGRRRGAGTARAGAQPAGPAGARAGAARRADRAAAVVRLHRRRRTGRHLTAGRNPPVRCHPCRGRNARRALGAHAQPEPDRAGRRKRRQRRGRRPHQRGGGCRAGGQPLANPGAARPAAAAVPEPGPAGLQQAGPAGAGLEHRRHARRGGHSAAGAARRRAGAGGVARAHHACPPRRPAARGRWPTGRRSNWTSRRCTASGRRACPSTPATCAGRRPCNCRPGCCSSTSPWPTSWPCWRRRGTACRWRPPTCRPWPRVSALGRRRRRTCWPPR